MVDGNSLGRRDFLEKSAGGITELTRGTTAETMEDEYGGFFNPNEI
ncbi:hypothetical protein [Candidatus Nanohalobium constans]|nr:hypothetical protein [Candidatus Nanohalobium constans]